MRRLKTFGFEFDRQGRGSHEIYVHRETRRQVPLVNHPKDYKEGTLRAILREAGVDVEAFLKA
ncbi:MAG TPA: type II toxin-antitoxin system HicA family toxin [Tepidisphaeraceae bacterium]